MSTWLTTPPPVNDSTPSNGLKAPVVGDTEISIRKQLKAIKGKEKRKHFIPVTKNPFLRPADLYIRLVFKEIWRYLEFVGRTWYNLFTQTFRDLFTTPSEDAQGLGEWFSHTFFAIGGIVVLPFALFLCLFARLPLLTRFYYTWSSLFGGNLGLVNSGNPNLFNELTWRQAEKAKTSLSSKSFDTAGNNRSSRVFDYDVAKMLLQIAAVIYEHENDAIRESASFRTPGEVYRYLVGKPHVKEKKRKEKSDRDAAIVRFCDTFRIDYYPVSELNNDSSAFCGLFWDPRSNWIIVAFKGTGPIEFGEWLTDLDATMVECKNLRHPVEEPKPYIEGFRWLHRGFKNRVFPDEGDFADAEKDKRPYNTISKSVKALSDHLAKSQPAGTKINIWFTGHSLISGPF